MAQEDRIDCVAYLRLEYMPGKSGVYIENGLFFGVGKRSVILSRKYTQNWSIFLGMFFVLADCAAAVDKCRTCWKNMRPNVITQ